MHTPTRPYSHHYQEHYWWNGAEEKQHTFLHGNNLPARFAALNQTDTFTVAELGFGTGLNALLTLHLHATTARGSHLTYISYEQHPFTLAGLSAIHATFPAYLQPFAQALQAVYAPQAGWNTWHLSDTTLHLYIGDASTGITTHPQAAHVWFLDGFSPAVNPAMWSPALMAAIHANTYAGGTASTYSVARVVKDALTGAGYTITRIAGHPPKQHMLTARKSSSGAE